MVKKTKVTHTSGKRKRAVARATLTPGEGKVKINNRALETWGTELLRLRIKEPLILSGKHAAAFDFHITVRGGGVTGQTDAIRLAIGRALVEVDPKLKSVLADYDRMLIVADVRRKESGKPNSHGKARAKKQKSYR